MFFLFIFSVCFFFFFGDYIKKLKQPDWLVYNKGAAAVTVCVGTCLAEGRETLAGAHSAAEDNKGHLKGSELHLGQTRQRERWSELPAAKCSELVCVCVLPEINATLYIFDGNALRVPAFAKMIWVGWRVFITVRVRKK